MLGDIDPLAPGRGVAQSGGLRAKWLIGLMGAGTLAPWNAWLLAYGYFDTVFGEHYNIAYVFTDSAPAWSSFSAFKTFSGC